MADRDWERMLEWARGTLFLTRVIEIAMDLDARLPSLKVLANSARFALVPHVTEMADARFRRVLLDLQRLTQFYMLTVSLALQGEIDQQFLAFLDNIEEAIDNQQFPKATDFIEEMLVKLYADLEAARELQEYRHALTRAQVRAQLGAEESEESEEVEVEEVVSAE